MADDALIDEIHRSAYVADGHADTLMWNRDLNARSEKGHVDFPRLAEGGAKMQCFTLVTRGLPVIDGFPIFTWWLGWPKEARRTVWTRALWQIDQLERFCAASGGKAAIAKRKGDLERNEAAGVLSAVLGVEGAFAVNGDPGNVQRLWDRGVRFMSLTHLGDSEIGGTSFPLFKNRGLSTLGKEILAEMARVGMAVDLAHASKRVLEDIFAGPSLPTFCSHTGLSSATESWRNLDDDTLREVQRRDGVVGVIFAGNFLGGKRITHLLNHIERGLAVVGDRHIVLGSDYDGFIKIPREMRDVRDVKQITRGLVERGVARGAIESVLGNGYRRFFTNVMA